MKVLYFSDNYAYENYGTKRSLFEGMIDAGLDMIWVDKSQIGSLETLVAKVKVDQVWCAHSNLLVDPAVTKRSKIPILGFGFSDPYYFSPSRFDSYHAYVTNHIGTYEKYRSSMKMHYNPTACDFKYHKCLPVVKDIDISVIGLGNHPRFVEHDERIQIVNDLRAHGHRVVTYGKGWPEHKDAHGHISEAAAFLRTINRSHLGLDIQDQDSPLAHRMFEYAGCGVPVITRFRAEVTTVFDTKMEIITYLNRKNLLDQVDYYMGRKAELSEIGKRAHERCVKDHDIKARVARLLPFVKSL